MVLQLAVYSYPGNSRSQFRAHPKSLSGNAIYNSSAFDGEHFGLVNSGAIEAGEGRAFLGGDAEDRIINSGRIVGAVELGADFDVYDGRNGLVDSLVDGGAGSDILRGGSEDNIMLGGSDDDVVSGGGGKDELEGNDGADSPPR